MKAGIALNPHTPVSLLELSLEGADLICLMSVNPGFGGQSFIENTYEKVRELRSMIDSKGVKTLIEIDGGVTPDNTAKLVQAGADILVAGSAVFRSEDPKETIARMASTNVY
jgi:ribulose-phosphate 3-epimerase